MTVCANISDSSDKGLSASLIDPVGNTVHLAGPLRAPTARQVLMVMVISR